MAKPPGKGPSRASRTAQTPAGRTQAGRTQAAKAKLAGAHAARTEAGRAKAGKAAPGKAAAGKASPAGSAAGGTRAAKPPAADAPAGKGQASKVGAGKAGAGKARATAQSAAGRQLTERVKTARGRKTSSQRWLQRQLNDPYVAAAKAQGYRSRAAWKLAEMDDRFRLLKPGARILDLGAAPGGWAQVAVERCGRNARIVALDINPMDPVPGAEVLLGDILDAETPARIRAALDGPADLVLSDMAPPATGHRQTDHIRIMALCEAALDLACEVLAPDGSFLCKVLQGGAEGSLLQRMKLDFRTVRHAKPPASRSDSAEAYVIAQGFRGAREVEGPDPGDPDPGDLPDPRGG